jgi:ankyrin repeat protein
MSIENIKIKYSIHRWRCAEVSPATKDIVDVMGSRMSSLEAFAKAIEKGDPSIVESLVSRGLVDVNARLPRMFQPPALVHAATYGRTEIVDILLRFNVRVDDADERGCTACRAAAEGGFDGPLALLLARQPNLDVVAADGMTALCYVLRYNGYSGVRTALMLLETGASLETIDRDDLCQFAATNTAVIKALINRGVVVREIVASNGSTPLHRATLDGRGGCAQDARQCVRY